MRGRTATDTLDKKPMTLNHTDVEKEELPGKGIDRRIESINLAVLRFPS